ITEEPDLYQVGGFHRVSLGDTFDSGKYTILRKLGYGQYSTVWLATDSNAKRYVAVKILRADYYGGPHDIFEREILSKISESLGKATTKAAIMYHPFLIDFSTKDQMENMCVFVFDVLGQHLDFQTVKYEDAKLPVMEVKVIARQLLLGLDFLHRECGIIHTDLKPTNILLELENPDEAISVPLREAIRTPLISDMNEPHIRIIDFGVASWNDKHLSDLIQSPALRAPEVTVGAPWDTSVDIWSLGCLMIEFVPRNTRIIEVLGPFPLQFLKKGSRTAQFFDQKGNLLRIPNMKPTSLERMINGTTKLFLKPKDMPDTEVPIFIDFLRGMLAIDPERRRSAADLLQHEWIKL
ncbi:protein kinase, partial [Lipomyces kononenkoae]